MDAKTKKELERLRHENAIMWERKGDERKSLEIIMRLRLELKKEHELSRNLIHALEAIAWGDSRGNPERKIAQDALAFIEHLKRGK